MDLDLQPNISLILQPPAVTATAEHPQASTTGELTRASWNGRETYVSSRHELAQFLLYSTPIESVSSPCLFFFPANEGNEHAHSTI